MTFTVLLVRHIREERSLAHFPPSKCLSNTIPRALGVSPPGAPSDENGAGLLDFGDMFSVSTHCIFLSRDRTLRPAYSHFQHQVARDINFEELADFIKYGHTVNDD
jgi:hypothetical protein